MRVLRTLLVTAGPALAACGDSTASPARVVVGSGDTVVINHIRPVRLPARVLDDAGRELPDTALRYRRVGGSDLPLSAQGVVTCTRAGDVIATAELEGVTTRFVLSCRPVHVLRLRGPVQLMVGDSAVELPLSAFDSLGRSVDMVAGTVILDDTAVAEVDAMRIRPKAAGVTLLEVRAGNRAARAGVHVYQPVATLDGLTAAQRHVAVALRLGPAEMRRWPLPAGTWMLTMLPEDDEERGLRLRVAGANCMPSGLTRRRYTCLARQDASAMIYHPGGHAATLAGTLLLRRTGTP